MSLQSINTRPARASKSFDPSAWVPYFEEFRSSLHLLDGVALAAKGLGFKSLSTYLSALKDGRMRSALGHEAEIADYLRSLGRRDMVSVRIMADMPDCRAWENDHLRAGDCATIGSIPGLGEPGYYCLRWSGGEYSFLGHIAVTKTKRGKPRKCLTVGHLRLCKPSDFENIYRVIGIYRPVQ